MASSERDRRHFLKGAACGAASLLAPAAQGADVVNVAKVPTTAPPEVRGTWLTTTANDALATPENTARTMQRLAQIGINTVYVEAWKNGYTQYPSKVLERTIGVAQRPAAARMDPSDPAREVPARDLLGEALIQAHRNGLICVAWFEYGFMAAHASTMPLLRRLKPDWLSRDISGSEVAPNGFVWMNPLHPQARRFLLDLMLEAIERYDLDGVQLDDRIVWPYVTMGYDDFTRGVYAAEHEGRQPPADPRDAAWMRWRADKLNALAREFVAVLRRARPQLLVSMSPAPYPWSYEHYLLEWPKWARWPASEGWQEFVPQNYRFSYAAFEATWLQQIAELRAADAYRPRELVAGIRLVGDGRADSSWEQLRDSINLARTHGNGGHVLWFSRGVLDRFPNELTAFYAETGRAESPRFAPGWRRPSVALEKAADGRWRIGSEVPPGRWRVVAFDGRSWSEVQRIVLPGEAVLTLPAHFSQAELIVDRR